MASCVITGSSGLVGTWVLHHWDIGDMVPVPLRGSDLDLLAPGAASELIRRTAPDAILHLAWCASGRADYRRSDDNERWVDATLALCESARSAGSTVWLTGTAVDDSPDAPDAYSRSKARLRTALSPAIAEGSVGWLRPFYVFDERWRRPGVVDLAESARAGGEAVLLQNPHRAHDFVHASDVGRAMVRAVSEGLTGEVQIGSGRLHTVAELVSALGARWSTDRTAVRPEHSHVGQPADTARLTALGWAPTRTEEFFAHV